MKKNGFTLVELLAVIAIMAMIAALVLTKVIDIGNSYKDTGEEYQNNLILNAAKQYVKGSETLKSKATTGLQISYQTLVNAGYLDINGLKNVRTGQALDNLSTRYVCITYNSTSKEYTSNMGTCN